MREDAARWREAVGARRGVDKVKCGDVLARKVRWPTRQNGVLGLGLELSHLGGATRSLAGLR